MNDFFFIVSLVLVSLWCGFLIGRISSEPAAKDIPALTEPTEVQEDDAIEFDDFTVAGKPRKPSWRQRRRELEAKARTKRKKLEEWSD